MSGTGCFVGDVGGYEQYGLSGSLVSAGSLRAGSVWVEGSSLHYIDAAGDERRYLGDPCEEMTYTFSTCTPTNLAPGICHETNNYQCEYGITQGVGVIATWTPKSSCTNGHMEFTLRRNGSGGYSSVRHLGDCNQADYTNRAWVSRAAWTSVSSCNGSCDDLQPNCDTEYWNYRLEAHHATAEVECDACVMPNSATRYVCLCMECQSLA